MRPRVAGKVRRGGGGDRLEERAREPLDVRRVIERATLAGPTRGGGEPERVGVGVGVGGGAVVVFPRRVRLPREDVARRRDAHVPTRERFARGEVRRRRAESRRQFALEPDRGVDQAVDQPIDRASDRGVVDPRRHRVCGGARGRGPVGGVGPRGPAAVVRQPRERAHDHRRRAGDARGVHPAPPRVERAVRERVEDRAVVFRQVRAGRLRVAADERVRARGGEIRAERRGLRGGGGFGGFVGFSPRGPRRANDGKGRRTRRRVRLSSTRRRRLPERSDQRVRRGARGGVGVREEPRGDRRRIGGGGRGGGGVGSGSLVRITRTRPFPAECLRREAHRAELDVRLQRPPAEPIGKKRRFGSRVV